VKIPARPAVVQWIARPPPKRQIQVRFLSVGPQTKPQGTLQGAPMPPGDTPIHTVKPSGKPLRTFDSGGPYLEIALSGGKDVGADPVSPGARRLGALS